MSKIRLYFPRPPIVGLPELYALAEPLRKADSTTQWASLLPLNAGQIPALRKYHRGRRPLVLLPAAGGRCKKRKSYERQVPVDADPKHFKLGLGPWSEGFYRRPEHLRGNKTKNKNPLQTKKRMQKYLGTDGLAH